MKKIGLLGTALLLAVGITAVGSDDVDARPSQKKDDEDSSSGPAKVPQAPAFNPGPLKFGMGHEKVFAVYDHVIDRDHVDRFKEVQPGVQMERLQHEIATKKQALRLSYTELDRPPSALDASPFVGEFTYYNDEAFMKIERKGRMRHLFFIKDDLWKTIDVYELGEDSKWGKTFESAVERVDEILEVKGRRREPGKDGARREEADWADDDIHLRVVDWEKGKVAVVFIDKSTEARLDHLRTNDGPDDPDIDPEVEKVLRSKKKKDDDEDE